MLKKALDIITKIVSKYIAKKHSGKLKLSLTLFFNKGGIRNVRLDKSEEEEKYFIESNS